MPLGPQPQVDAVGLAAVGVAPRAAGRPRRRRRAKNSPLRDAAPRASGLAVLVVDEHQVDVAGVVQLLAAELAERQHAEPTALAIGAERLAILLFEVLAGVYDRSLDNRVGEIRNLLAPPCRPRWFRTISPYAIRSVSRRFNRRSEASTSA